MIEYDYGPLFKGRTQFHLLMNQSMSLDKSAYKIQSGSQSSTGFFVCRNGQRECNLGETRSNMAMFFFINAVQGLSFQNLITWSPSKDTV